MVSRQRLLISTGAALIGLGSVSAVVPAPAKAAGSPIGFGVPAPVDPIHGVGEPDIGVDRAGNVFVSGPAGTGEQRSLWWGSADGGNTYRVIEPIAEAVPSGVVSTPNLPGGGDTEIAFDNQTPQKQYFSDLVALSAIRNVTTSTEGASETQQTHSAPPAGTDRQWLVVYDPPAGVASTSPASATHPIIYQSFNGPAWQKSTDGINFTSATSSSPFGVDGHPAIDQVTGDVFQSTDNGSGLIQLNIGAPKDASGNLCFLDDAPATCAMPAAQYGGDQSKGLITVASGVDENAPGGGFVVTSMDSARNLYVVWEDGNFGGANDHQEVFVAAAPANNATPYLGCSTSCWNHWTTPVQVSDNSAATGDQQNTMPWIAAGGPGMADAAWYGDSSSLSPSATCVALSPGCHVWNVFMNQLAFPTDGTGVITGAAPSTNLVKVTPHPMDYQDICLSGTGCVLSNPPGNRNLADFFEVTIDKTGAAEIVYDDMSNNLIQAASNQLDHAGLPLPTVIRQTSGPGLFGATVSGASAAPLNGLDDATGDALYPVIGGSNLPAMDLTNVGLSLDGTTGALTATIKVADLTQLSSVASAVPGTTLEQFLVRWQMGNTLYYAEASLANSTGAATFSAGKTSSVDLCSVSACRPLVAVYGESANPAAGQTTETGSVTCPTSPSATNPCTITITVNGADVGSPAATDVLEEVGGYAYASSHPQSGTTNAQAEVDSVPLEIDGVCCFNFAGAPAVSVAEVPWSPGLVGLGVALVIGGVVRRRSRARREARATC